VSKGKRQVFDMAKQIKLKKGGLVLRAEKNGEPVYVNGKQVGKTPFSGSVPLCAVVEIGKSRERVGVVLEHNGKVVHTVEGGDDSRGYFTDSRDGKKYKTVTIGRQTWMAENLNYKASGSKCYDNNPANCQKYGRLYNWWTAMMAVCPNGWHLSSNAEWQTLVDFAGGYNIAGKYLKAKSGWNFDKGKSGNGTDAYGFSALPGGVGNSDGYHFVGYRGSWWGYGGDGFNAAYIRDVFSGEEVLYMPANSLKDMLISVRCVQD